MIFNEIPEEKRFKIARRVVRVMAGLVILYAIVRLIFLF